MPWCDRITLVSLAPPKTDAGGNYLPQAEAGRRMVFADKMSIGTNEIYQSQQAGIAVELKFKVYTAEFNGETLVEYAGKRYRVFRTWATPNGEYTELTLQSASAAATQPETPQGGPD